MVPLMRQKSSLLLSPCLIWVFACGSGWQHQSGMVKDHSYSHLALHLMIALIMGNAMRFSILFQLNVVYDRESLNHLILEMTLQ